MSLFDQRISLLACSPGRRNAFISLQQWRRYRIVLLLSQVVRALYVVPSMWQRNLVSTGAVKQDEIANILYPCVHIG